jgi:hypothetical protein
MDLPIVSSELFPSLPHLPTADDWRLSIRSELRRLGEPQVWRVYDALHAYDESSHSYLEAVRKYSEALASGHCFIGYLAELRTRIADALGAAQTAFSRASTALQQFATDVGGGGVVIDTPAAPQRRTERAEQHADIPARRSPPRRSRSRSPGRR